MELRNCLLILLVILPVATTRAGDIKAQDTTSIDLVKMARRLNSTTLIYQDATHTINVSQLASLNFTDTFPKQLKVVPEIVRKDIYLKFIITNGSDSAISCYFFPGIYFEESKLFVLGKSGNSVEPVRGDDTDPKGFKKMTLVAHETNTYFARLKLVKTNTHTFSPVLIRDYYLNPYIASFQNEDKSGNTITFVFSGILLMMIFYSIAVYILNRNIEFVYYAGYAFCLGLMLFLKAYLYRKSSPFINFFEAYLDFVLQSAGTFIYLAFLRKFIESKKNFPWIHKLMLVEQCVIIASIGLFSYLYFETDNFALQNAVEGFSKFIWVIGAFIFIIYTLNKKNPLLYYLAFGHTFLIAGGLMSLYLINASAGANFRRDHPGPIGNALTYYEVGLVVELMFFLTALALKNRTDIVVRTKEGEQLKLKTEMQDFEKQIAVLSAQQDERNRISADMHDELGSGVTAIRLMSEILKQKMKDTVYPELDKISNSANELIIKMNTLIWTMKSDNDSVESLVTYVRIYALEFFDNTPIDCIVRIPPYMPNIELTGGKRRNLFLSVKETLNNVLKHSKADKVIITFEIDVCLKISVSDNGVGIDHNNLRRFGSGLGNIRERIERIDGSYSIDNNPEGGAKTTMVLTL